MTPVPPILEPEKEFFAHRIEFAGSVLDAINLGFSNGLAVTSALKSLLTDAFTKLEDELKGLLPSTTMPTTPSTATTMPSTATADGCPHFTTYDGLHFDFQGAGEFIAARSTQAGNTFQVQMRIEPEGSLDSAVSIITQIAVQVGTDRITFGVPQGTDAPRPDVVLVNGAPAAISQTNPVLTFDGGTVTEVSASEYRVALNTGEVVTVNPFGNGMGYSITLPTNGAPGSVQGFLGPDEGQANDFQLPDGTVLQQPLTQNQLYHQFADAWRVTDSNSLFDYGPGQTTASFTNTMFPREILTLADFSPDLVAKAAALATAAGITDPTLAADAEFDYLSMGNPSYFSEDATVAARNSTVPIPAVITQLVPPPPSIGVLPVDPQVVEAAGDTTPVAFVVNLTSAAATDTVVDYTAASPTGTTSGKDFLTAADFGGTLPSGSVTIPAGQTQADLTIDVPNSAIGSASDKWLMVTTSSPGGNLLYSPAGQAEILNNQSNQSGTPIGFDGDQVSLAAYYPEIAPTNIIGAGSATVAPGITTFPSFAALENGSDSTRLADGSLALSGDTMTFLYSSSEEGTSFIGAPFNGYEIQTAESDPAITAASIISTNIPGFTAADLSFSSHTVDVNVAGLTLPRDAPGSIVLGFSFADQSLDVLTPVRTNMLAPINT